jgi:hypothetical protein
MRVDLHPSIVNLDKVVVFQRAVRELMGRVDISDGRAPIVLTSIWPPNISYAISIGDLRVPMSTGDQILSDEPISSELVSVVLGVVSTLVIEVHDRSVLRRGEQFNRR